MHGQFTLLLHQPALSALWQAEDEGLFGAFNVAGVTDVMATPLPDGIYVNLLDDRPVEVRDGEMAVPETAVILRYAGQIDPAPHIAPPILFR